MPIDDIIPAEMKSDTAPQADFLDEISDLEDGFDVDLMACGCRVHAPETKLQISVCDVIKLYNLDQDDLGDLLAMVVEHAELEPEKLFEMAEELVANKPEPVKLTA